MPVGVALLFLSAWVNRMCRQYCDEVALRLLTCAQTVAGGWLFANSGVRLKQCVYGVRKWRFWGKDAARLRKVYGRRAERTSRICGKVTAEKGKMHRMQC